MHSIFSGVVKSLIKFWFDHPGISNYPLKSKMKIINNILLEISPPSFFASEPRSL